MTNKDIKNAYIGTTEVKAMYLGSTKVWSKEQVEVTDGVYIMLNDWSFVTVDQWKMLINQIIWELLLSMVIRNYY